MFNEDKNCYTKYPLCISCKSLIRLEEIIISNKKTIYIRFRCVCRTKHKIIELQKYLYGIELLFKLGNKTGIPPDCINCILIKDEKDTHMFTNIMICSELYCIQHKLKSEYCCLQCKIHVCPSCIETDHKEHDYIKDEEFHERTKQKIKSMGDIESYIKTIIQSKHEVIEHSIFLQLIFVLLLQSAYTSGINKDYVLQDNPLTLSSNLFLNPLESYINQSVQIHMSVLRTLLM